MTTLRQWEAGAWRLAIYEPKGGHARLVAVVCGSFNYVTEAASLARRRGIVALYEYKRTGVTGERARRAPESIDATTVENVGDSLL